ncbi:MAG: DUF4956 domain-containing protein [Clostridium butyricum]|nr:DUF4956 domain-containing protein [Clostridium butyricum]
MNQSSLNFNDILKSNFIEKVTAVSYLDIFIALTLAFIVGLFIMQVYKKSFKGVMYSESFALSLLGLSLVSTLIILAVTSNVVLSLGMVGALSIVRFRSAIKEPIDIVYLFWSISVGIVLGAGLIPLAIIGSILIGIVLVLFANRKSINNPYILVINCENDKAETNAIKVINTNVGKHVVKSKTVSPINGIEMIVEIRLNRCSTDFVNEISNLNGISNVVLVSYNGDYMS